MTLNAHVYDIAGRQAIAIHNMPKRVLAVVPEYNETFTMADYRLKRVIERTQVPVDDKEHA